MSSIIYQHIALIHPINSTLLWKGNDIKDFEKALDARSKLIAKQLNDLDRSTGKKLMEDEKKSNRIGAGNGEGGNSMRLRGFLGGGEELSGRIGTRTDTVNKEQQGNGNSIRIAGGGKVGGKNYRGSDKHNSGKVVNGKGGHGNDEKDDSVRLKRPLDSDTLNSSTDFGHSGKILGGGGANDSTLNGIIDTSADGMDNRHGNVTLDSTIVGRTNGNNGKSGGGSNKSISVDTTLGMLVELDSMKNRLQGRDVAGEIPRLKTNSSLDDMIPDKSNPNNLGGNHANTGESIQQSNPSAPAMNAFGYPIASNHAR